LTDHLHSYLHSHLHCEVSGDEGKPSLQLLHGFMSSNLQWAPNWDALRRAFRVVAVELWGHGKSPAPETPALYTVDRYVDELARIRQEFGGRHWWICGQSFGAGIAIRAALANPETLQGLIITNSRSALNDVSAEAGSAGDLDSWQAVDKRSLPFHPCHARRFPAELKQRMEVAANAIPPYALWQATSTTARDLSCRGLVGQLAVPTLLVNGRYEKSFQADRDFAASANPSIEIVDLDAGHSVNIEAPSAFERAVVDFVAKHAT